MKPIYTYILIIVLIAGAAFFADKYMAAGFTTTGISKLEFSGYDNILSGDVWTINFVQGGMAQSIYGSMAANSQDTTGGSEKTIKGFSLDIDKSNQKCLYPIIIDEDTIPIYKIDYVKFFLSTYNSATEKCAVPEYAGSKDNIILVYKPFLSTGYYCLYKMPQSSKVATFNDDSLKFTTNFKVKIGDDTYTKRISTDKSLVKFSDVAYIKWLGNLNSGDTCPNPAETRRAILIDGKWKIIGTANYDTYRDYYITNVKFAHAPSEAELKNIKYLNNNYADKALEERSFKGMSGETAYTTGYRLNNGKVYIDLYKFINFPKYVAYISADEVKGIGVYQPVATPKVVSVDDIIFKTGTTGYVSGVIKNVGSERGGFETFVKCDRGISMTGSSDRRTLEAGQSYNVIIDVTGTAIADVSCKLCTRVLDEEDCMRFTATVSARQICTPGQQMCMDGIAKTCRDDGTGYYDDGDDERCEVSPGEEKPGIASTLADALDEIMKEIFGEEFINKLFGEKFGFDDIIPAAAMIVAVVICIIVVINLIPIILPLLGRALLGLIVRK